MACCKGDWILFAATLVGCVLVSTAADDVKASEELVNNLKRADLAPSEIKVMLRDHPDRQLVIYLDTVEDLTEWCRPSLSRCFHGEFDRLYHRMHLYLEHFPRLEEYGKYCRDVELKRFCVERIDKVAQIILDNESAEDESLVQPFWNYLEEFGISEEAHEAAIGNEKLEEKRKIYDSIRSAYFVYMHEKYGNGLDVDKEEEFFHNLTRALLYYSDNFEFFRRLGDDDEVGPVPKNSRTTSLFKFGRVASQFIYVVAGEIFRDLEQRLSKELGRPSQRQWATVMKQIKREYLACKKNVNAAAMSQEEKWQDTYMNMILNSLKLQ